jgi:hypothetical protein
MIASGGVEVGVKHLRKAKDRTIQKNLAIYIAKLCKVPKGLEIARSLEAIHLIASLKIL